ncbi:MAG TPA: DNA primase [Burkholderiales bacterium]|nr:DNA primase [Burkholderiales bacterium]
MISESFKQDLLNRIDIVDVIHSRVPLKKAGANWTACCPFHNEKTPSFTVSPSKQFYHCFGCGAHGNAIGFLMEYAGLGYVDAVQDLAQSAGMKMPEQQSGERFKQKDGPDLYDLMQRAAQYYRDQLKNSARAIDYLKGRGLSGGIAARFGIGYAPAGWQNLSNVFERYDDRSLLDCGLVIENDQGKRYDRFRDRVMFPILNQRGSVIGFGGRVLSGEDSGPKYMNSPETPLFEKGRELYGLTQARQAIREANRVLVVEGYMDVVALAQHGVENAVATLGTATTPIHVQKLMRLADEVVFCFDGDAAGRRAAWHALEVSLESLADKKALKFLFLPAEHDPDSFVREFGAERFDQHIREAQPLSAFMLDHLRKQADLATIEGRAKLVAEAKGFLKRIAAPGLQLQLVKALAQMANMEQIEVARLTDIRLAATYQRLAPKNPARTGADNRLERELLRCVLAQPELISRVDIELLDLSRPEGRTLTHLADILQESLDISPALLCERFRGSEHEKLINELQAELMKVSTPDGDLETVFAHSLEALQDRRRRARLAELEAKINAGQASREEKTEFGTLSSHRRKTELASGAGAPT